MTLAEMTDTLHIAGFDVQIAESHNYIIVSLNRKVGFDEIEAACGYEISSAIRMHRHMNGKSVIISE